MRKIKLALKKIYKFFLKSDNSLPIKKPYFDSNYYLEKNIDIFIRGLDPFKHFLDSGQFENRDPARTISSDWIQFKYQSESENPFQYLVDSIPDNKFLSPNPLFDSNYYVDQIGGIKALNGLTPYDHFLQMGLASGLQPNSWLDVEKFASANSWYFNKTTSNFEKFVNLFELVRNNSIFDQYVCFRIQNSKGEAYQLTEEIFNEYLKSVGKVSDKRDSHDLSNWQILEVIYELSSKDFLELENLTQVHSYPPKIINSNLSADSNKLEIKRVVFFCHWSSKSEVAAWIKYTLETYKQMGLQIIFNTNLDLSLLPDFVSENCLAVIQRTNSGHDFESHVLTWNWLNSHNIEAAQVILTNDSHFFPMSDTTKLKKELDESISEFWALTENTWSQRHLQSFFLVLNGSAIVKYFAFLNLILKNWKYISKMGLINILEIKSHEFAKDNGYIPNYFFSGIDPTFNTWDKLQNFGVPILKVHLVRKLLLVAPGDTKLLKEKLESLFSQSPIRVSNVIDYCREIEINNSYQSLWFNK